MFAALGTTPLGALPGVFVPDEEPWSFLTGYTEPEFSPLGFVAGMDGFAFEEATDPFYQLCLQGPDFLLTYLSWESMFTDGRASKTDVIQEGEDQRGWFGDHAPVSVGGTPWNQKGSTLWTSYRVPLADLTPAKIQQDIERAHEWMIDAGLILGCTVTVAKTDGAAIAAEVVLTTKDGETQRLSYANLIGG